MTPEDRATSEWAYRVVLGFSAEEEVFVLRDLTVVTQPEFIRSRGDRYLSTVSPDAIQDLYRCGSLLRAGVAVKASSDAPYGDLNPWLGVQAAADRYTAGGAAWESKSECPSSKPSDCTCPITRSTPARWPISVCLSPIGRLRQQILWR